MSNKRNKQHKPGERISVYLNKDLPPHFFEWLSKQDDVSPLVLYALERLYAETGNINVSGYLPRRFFFEDSSITRQHELPPRKVFLPPSQVETRESPNKHNEGSTLTEHTKFEETEHQKQEEPVIRENKEQSLQFESTSYDGHEDIEETFEGNTKPESIKTNTKWANLDHVNPDNF